VTRFHVLIPARYASSRLPGKPLREIAGKPMLQHVYERGLESGAGRVVIATDDDRIRAAAEQFGAEVCVTGAHHRSGSERLAEATTLLELEEEAVVVNLQGDEPLMPPRLLHQVAADLAAHARADVSTLSCRITTAAELFDPNVVKVVTDRTGYALYFSRATIPWDREAFAATTEQLPESAIHHRHLGIYAYRAGYLRHYAGLAHCVLERMEALEQLRVLWHGGRIHVAEAETLPGPGVDTSEDLERVQALLADSASAGVEA